MVELTGKGDHETYEAETPEKAALRQFHYKKGYSLLCSDLGSEGVKVELGHSDEDASAVVLPPDKVRQCARWMLRTLELRNHDSLKELPEILQRIITGNGSKKAFKRGDKKKLREAMKFIANFRSSGGA